MENQIKRIDIETDKYYVSAMVSVDYKKVDESFDTEFGLERQYGWVPSYVEILGIRDPETGREVEMDPELEKLIIDKAMN